MAHRGLLGLALLTICLAALCTADDLMMDEEGAFDNLKDEAQATKDIDVVFLIHTSTKINKVSFKHYQDLMKDVVKEISAVPGKIRFATVAFRKNAKIEFNLNKFKTVETVLAGIDGLKLAKSKVGSLIKGFNIIKTKVFGGKAPAKGKKKTQPQPPGTKLVILLTDAKSAEDQTKINTAAKSLRESGAQIYAFGIGLDDISQLQSTATNAFSVNSYAELGKAKNEIVKILESLQLKDEAGDDNKQSTDSRKADIAIAYHLSNKITPKDITNYFIPLLRALFEKARIDTGDVRVAFINYAKRGRNQVDFNKITSSAELIKQLSTISAKDRAKISSGGTALKEIRAKFFNKKGGDRDEAANSVILFTDAKNSDDTEEFFSEAESLKRSGVKIITVGFEDADASELARVASQPAERNAVFSKSYAKLTSADVIDPIRNAIGALQEGPAATGAPPRATLVTQRATTVPPKPKPAATTTTPATVLQAPDQADIIFGIHFNPEKSDDDFQHLISFLRSLALSSDVDSGKVRFALLFDRDNTVFNLNEFSSNERLNEFLTTVSRKFVRQRKFDLLNLLKSAREKVFKADLGDRSDSANILLILTDTKPDQQTKLIQAEKANIKKAGITVYSVGIGLEDKKEMENVASSTDNVFAFADYRELSRLGSSLRQQIKALNTRTGWDDDKIIQPTVPLPLPECALAKADLVIVIDSSTSVTEVNFKKVLDFIKDFLSKADIDSGNVRVGLVLYSSEVYPIFQLKTYQNKRDILRAVDNVEYRFGATNTAAAISYMTSTMFTPVNGDRADVHNIAVVLTDGVSTVEPENTISNAQLAQEDGIHIYTIGVGLTDTRELDGIASPPAQKNSFKVNNFDELQAVDDLIFASACPKLFTMPIPTTTTTTTRPTTTATPRPTTTSIRRITVTTTPKSTTTTRPTTTRRTTTTTTLRPTTTTQPTTTTIRRTITTTTRSITTRRPTTPRRRPVFKDNGTDIIYMLDSTVDNRIFGWMKSFLQDFTGQINVDNGDWRVGGMTFDTNARSEFQLNRYAFNDEVINGLNQVNNRPTKSDPDIARAFDYVRQSMFVNTNGDRPRARNYVILLTGKEKSLNTGQSYAAANRLKDLGVNIYSIGFNFRDSTELDEISSKPLDEFRSLVYSQEQLGELASTYLYNMNRAPPPTIRTTTPRRVETTSRKPPPPYTGECKSRGDVIFVLDSSGSVGEDNFRRMKNFTYAAVRDLDTESGNFNIGVLTFSDTANIEFNLKDYSSKEDIYNAIQKIPYVYGQTNTAEALRRVRTEMFTSSNSDRADVPNLLVVVTDGQSNINHLDTQPEARRLKATGTTIVTVGVGVEDETELRGLTSPPVDENMIKAINFESLEHISQLIVTPLCTDVNMCKNDPCQNGGACVDGLRSYLCVCKSGFYGDNCEKTCGPPTDVVIILDSSTSVGSTKFSDIKSYARRLVGAMDVLTCSINVGVIKYSSAAMIQFNLGTYRTEEEITRAISAISYTPGRANMAEAFRVVRTQMFNNRNGDRYNARNIAYLLTDGSVEINRDLTPSEVELTLDAGVRIIPLAIAVRDRTEIQFIAEAQKMQLLEIESEENLMEQQDQVLEAVTDRENRCNPNPCNNGGECINEALGFTCKCPEGFAGELCDRACSSSADIVFLVDASRYNTGTDFRSIKKFVRNVIKKLAFKDGNFRVGVVEYGDQARLRLDLLEGDNKRTINSVVGSLRRQSGDPNLTAAVKLVSAKMFGKIGDRKEVPNYLVLVTREIGGVSSIEAINDLKATGTKVIGIGIGLSNSDEKYLEAAVSAPVDETRFIVDAVSSLEAIPLDFVNFVCQDKNACEANPCQNGGTCENGEKSYVCRCRPGFAGKNCDRACDDRSDIVFLIDSSGSVGFESFRRIKDYIHHIIDDLNIGSEATQVGVATFSQNSRAEIYLNSFQDKRKLQAAVSGITFEYGNTNTASGIKLVRTSLFSPTKGNRPDVPDFLVIITDGLSNVNAEATLPEAALARKQGIHIFAVGVNVGDPWELNGIASPPVLNNVFRVNDWEGLWGISEQLIDSTCRDNGVCAENPCYNGGTCITGIGTFTCQCPQGYLGKYCELDCQRNKDIAFILDASSSVGPTNFNLQLQYVSSMVKDLTLYGQDHRFSLIVYSTEVKTIFSFNRYNNVANYINAIETTPYTAGSTNTAGGLRQAIQMFTPEFGDRPTAVNVAILMTDGQSNVNYWDTIPAANDLKNKTRVIAIGIGLQNEDEVRAIASSGRDVFLATGFANLTQIEQKIIEGTCNDKE